MAVHATRPLRPLSLGSHTASAWLVLRVRFSGAGLDARLAAGEDPASDPALALRAVQLTRARARGRIASGLERVCADSRPKEAFSAAIPVNRRAVQLARPALTQLGAALRDGGAVEVRGVVLAQAILTDLTGPLYQPAGEDTLDAAACEALLALRPGASGGELRGGG